MSPSKRCPDCGETKPLDGFYKDRRTTLGVTVYCKSCSLTRKRRYDETHAEQVRERQRIRARSPEGLAKARAAYWANPDHYRQKALRNKNKSKAADAESRRRAKMRGGAVEKFERAEIYLRDGGKCHLCGERVPAAEFHLDHLIPIAKGGSHTRENVAVAHRVCNQRRGDGRIPAQLLLVG